MDCSTFFVWRVYQSIIHSFFALSRKQERVQCTKRLYGNLGELWEVFFFCVVRLCIFLLNFTRKSSSASASRLFNWDSKHVEYERRNLHLSPVTKWCQNCRGYITFFAFEDKGTRRLRTFASECQTHWKCIESCEFPRVPSPSPPPYTFLLLLLF